MDFWVYFSRIPVGWGFETFSWSQQKHQKDEFEATNFFLTKFFFFWDQGSWTWELHDPESIKILIRIVSGKLNIWIPLVS